MDWGHRDELTALDVPDQPLPELDNEERTRLRDVIGPRAVSAAEPVRRRRNIGAHLDLRDGSGDAPVGAEERLLGLSFMVGDIDRKIEKLAETPVLVEQLGDQVRRLSERMARIEHLLAATDQPGRVN